MSDPADIAAQKKVPIFVVLGYFTAAGWSFYPGETFDEAALRGRGVTDQDIEAQQRRGTLELREVPAGTPGMLPLSEMLETLAPQAPPPPPEA